MSQTTEPRPDQQASVRDATAEALERRSPAAAGMVRRWRELAAQLDIADPGSILRFGQEAQNRATARRRCHAGRCPQPRGRARPASTLSSLLGTLRGFDMRGLADEAAASSPASSTGPGPRPPRCCSATRPSRARSRRSATGSTPTAPGCWRMSRSWSGSMARRSTGSMRSVTTSPPATAVLGRVDRRRSRPWRGRSRAATAWRRSSCATSAPPATSWSGGCTTCG